MPDSDDSNKVERVVAPDGQEIVTIGPPEEQPKQENSSRDRMYDPIRDLQAVKEAIRAEYAEELTAKDAKIFAWESQYTEDMSMLNGLLEQQKKQHDERVAGLEAQIAELTEAIREIGQEHNLVEGEDGVNISEREQNKIKRDTLTGLPAFNAKDGMADYLKETFRKIIPELESLVGESGMAETARHTSEWASKYGRRARGELYKRLTTGKLSEREASGLVMDLVAREVLVDSLFQDFKELAATLDDKLKEYEKQTSEIEAKESDLQNTIDRAGEVVEARAAVDQREAEAASLEKSLLEKEERLTQRKEAADIREDDLQRREEGLESDILSFRSYTNVFTGYAASMRDMFYAKYTGFLGRVQNIRKEHGEKHGVKGVALIPSARYKERLEPGLKEMDITDGLSDEKVLHLKKRVSEVKKYDQPVIGRDAELGGYMIGPIVNDRDVTVAHFCITGIPAPTGDRAESQDPRNAVERGYAQVMLDTYESVRASVLTNYGALHFLGPHLNYLMERMERLLPEEKSPQS